MTKQTQINVIIIWSALEVTFAENQLRNDAIYSFPSTWQLPIYLCNYLVAGMTDIISQIALR